MFKAPLYFLLFLLPFSLYGQMNLVPNPSFEVYDTCPNNMSQMNLAVPWFQVTDGTPDYLNQCSTSWIASTPSNWVGHQPARTGFAYSGCFAYLGMFNDYHEYIGVQLLEPMKKGKKYCVELYVSLADTFQFATDAFGVFFSDSAFSSYVGGGYLIHLPVIPQIENPIGNYLSDKIGWTLISGKFEAVGGEQYMIIGNFNSNTNTNVISALPGAFLGSYYYIDDISVFACDSSVDASISNVFTPNNDGVNDFWKITTSGLPDFSCTIINRWGTVISEISLQDQGWDGKDFNGKDCPDGVYFYLINAKGYDEKEYEWKGFVQLIR